ncbi:MAG: DUF1800 domain-containing protein [Taibaiella sp.]|nr:DUF1800 domain-containing protein [Taibaiella sp.]
MTVQEQNKLLYARAAFGISLNNYLSPTPIEKSIEQLFPKASPGRLETITAEEWAQNTPKMLKSIGDDMQRKEMQKTFRQRIGELNLLWMQAMVDTQYPLLEKMTIFWHGHFAARSENPYFGQLLLNELRHNALGNFGDLLRSVSKSPEMLQFLNNQQNRKMHPNENFAREVMELFTLGRGHYTEQDIKEAARAFTGWGFDEFGAFTFRKGQHDDGEKTFLGKTGNFNGDDILNILLAQKQTALYITQKIYRYVVSDDKINEKRVKDLSTHFYDSNYDISALLKRMFTADWFYTSEIPGSKIKSPIDLLVGYQRMFPVDFKNPRIVINLQRVLGQYLFFPPNVAGWPGGKDWIDSSSLVIRMRLPEALFASKELDLTAKEIDAEMNEANKKPLMQDGHASQQFTVGKASVDWAAYIKSLKAYNRNDVAGVLAHYLLPIPIAPEKLEQINGFADKRSDEDYIKSITILLMELPEYQLC